jgi:cysteine desulfurase/selenocysteine lyase
MADWHTIIRERDFPMIEQAECDGRPVIYLDNAATTQCARPVLWALENYWRSQHANVYRGVYCLSRRAEAAVEETRQICAEFLGAASAGEIVFTGGATQSANLLADAFALTELKPGDLVLSTEMEHHSNLLPWREACRRTGAELALVPVTEEGELDLDALDRLLERRPKLLAVCAVSNVLGTVNPLREIADRAHAAGCAVAVDAAQAMRCCLPGVRELDCDFLYFSSHKVMGPTGVGVLYGSEAWLERLTPPRTGGGMVSAIREDTVLYERGPLKFEAGTPNLAGIAGLGAALEYMQAVGRRRIAKREKALLQYAEKRLRELPGLRILGAPKQRAGVLSFVAPPLQAYDIAMLLDSQGIAVRSGSHCAIPLHRRLGLSGSVRVSPAFYNTAEELDALTVALRRSLEGAKKAGVPVGESARG